MDIRAILLIGGADLSAPTECIGGVPLAYLDVLGVPLVERVLRRLRRFGISSATVIGDCPHDDHTLAGPEAFSPDVPRVKASGEQLWRAAEDTFLRCAEEGADLVLALRVGPYVELDYEELIQHHLDHRCPVTMTVAPDGSSLRQFVLSASCRMDAAALFQNRLQHLRRDCAPFQVAGYVNPVRTASDLRRLAVDGLMKKNAVHPEGTEAKPGIWVGPWARIHPKARVIAPAYIGARAKIRASALITRGSIVEHHAEIDCGTVVENSTVLPFSRVGAGLDVMHSVVGFRHLVHTVRQAEVEISDSRLVGMVPFSPVSRLAGSTAALFAFLPKQIYRGFFAPSHRKSAAETPQCPDEPGGALDAAALEAPATGTEASEFPANLAVARRYGDQ